MGQGTLPCSTSLGSHRSSGVTQAERKRRGPCGSRGSSQRKCFYNREAGDTAIQAEGTACRTVGKLQGIWCGWKLKYSISRSVQPGGRDERASSFLRMEFEFHPKGMGRLGRTVIRTLTLEKIPPSLRQRQEPLDLATCKAEVGAGCVI